MRYLLASSVARWCFATSALRWRTVSCRDRSHSQECAGSQRICRFANVLVHACCSQNGETFALACLISNVSTPWAMSMICVHTCSYCISCILACDIIYIWLDNILQGVEKRFRSKQDLRHLRSFPLDRNQWRKLWKQYKQNWGNNVKV